MTLSVCSMGESTRAQPQAEAARDAAAREHAVDVDSEDEAVMGGAPVRGVLHAASQLTFADLSFSQRTRTR